ncbi:MAG: L,D-transpeptidase family protein [Anaerolineales bacterium]|jgi:lipoprotein-anchoring transpeptidase ErfK/SrfK
MNDGFESAQQALLNAQQAVRQGDRQTARRCAEIAASLSPDLEEPWLILAAVGSPRASVEYLEQALRINPQSERARLGMHWAVDRLRRETPRGKNSGPPDKPIGGGLSQAESFLEPETKPLRGRKPSSGSEISSLDSILDPETKPHIWMKSSAGIEISQPDSNPQEDTRPLVAKKPQVPVSATPPVHAPLLIKSLAKYRWSFLTLVFLALCVSAVWVFWPGNASPVFAFLHTPQSVSPVFGAPIKLDKPTYTSTVTSTFTPTDTYTPSPTFTLTSTPTATFTPTHTPRPTNTPRPTSTPTPAVADYSGRWIEVDLSQQMLYAHEGDTTVASFLVSTGVPAFPTVTGRYYIYIKLLSTLMEGDGYYLPNVPYTMYFYRGYGIHGTYWHHNFGHPMSHGCVNMYTPDAKWMFNWASVGTMVIIHY